MQEEEKAALLRNHLLLQHLRDWDLKRLAMVARTEERQAGEIIVEKDAPGGSMFVVITGQVLIFNRSLDGREIVFNLIGPEEVFGEISVLDGKPRTASAKALQATRLLVLERRHLLPFLQEAPQVCIELLAVLCERLRRTTTQLEDNTFMELRPRLARKLSDFAEHYGEQRPDGSTRIALAFSQTQLGAMLGASRESVNRCLSEWVKAGWIAQEQGSITLLDRDSLDDVGAGDA